MKGSVKNIFKYIFNPIGNIIKAIRDMDKFWRFILTWLLCGVAVLLIDQSDYSQMTPKEENYEELTQVVHYMSQNQSVEKIPNENVKCYEVTFNEDKTIDIYLQHQGAETISATLAKDYDVLTLERGPDHFATFLGFVIAVALISLVSAAVIHLFIWLVAKIFAFFISIFTE